MTEQDSSADLLREAQVAVRIFRRRCPKAHSRRAVQGDRALSGVRTGRLLQGGGQDGVRQRCHQTERFGDTCRRRRHGQLDDPWLLDLPPSSQEPWGRPARCTSAAEQGAAPTQAVRDRFGVARPPRRAGSAKPDQRACSPKWVRARVPPATALGLDDDVLIEAVREHADGTLRVGRHAARGPCAAGVAEDAPRAAQPGGVTCAAAASRCAPASGRL